MKKIYELELKFPAPSDVILAATVVASSVAKARLLMCDIVGDGMMEGEPQSAWLNPICSTVILKKVGGQ
jgi:hypothetical protein